MRAGLLSNCTIFIAGSRAWLSCIRLFGLLRLLEAGVSVAVALLDRVQLPYRQGVGQTKLRRATCFADIRCNGQPGLDWLFQVRKLFRGQR